MGVIEDKVHRVGVNMGRALADGFNRRNPQDILRASLEAIIVGMLERTKEKIDDIERKGK